MSVRKVRIIGICVVTTFAAALALAEDKHAAKWEPIGLSGGGAMYAPAISPIDPKLMFVNCDMSAAYVSRDQGSSWTMIHHAELRSSTRCRPAFHPTDAKLIVAANGDAGLKVSRDRGDHWAPLGKLPGAPRGEVAIDATRPDVLLVGLDDGCARSVDGGASWARCDGPKGEGLAFHFDQSTQPAHRVCFAATRKGVWRSDDGGETWAAKTQGLSSDVIVSFSGGSNAKAKTAILYCCVPTDVQNGALTGGIFVSKNRGELWESAMGEGLNKETKAFDQWAASKIARYAHVVTSDARPTTVWAWNAGTGIPPPHHCSAYRSDDSGKTWQPMFQGDPRYPGISVERDYTVANVHQFYQSLPNGVAGCASNADIALSVDNGCCFLTVDGGKSWKAAHTRAAPGSGPDDKDSRWLCNGLVVTTTWNYYIDPFDPNRHTICYTDIGFARSLDKGKTWLWWPEKGRAPWQNTCYELAFDPQVQGKVWGAFSNVHDIPNDNIISGRHGSTAPGGVCVSTDAGATWSKSNTGLPDAPIVSIALDPKSKPGARVLYAASFGHGVYRSTDDGATWSTRTDVGSADDKRAVRVQVHADGTLFALVTALKKDGKFVSEGPGLYRSKDQGASWENVTQSQPLLWPKDFTLDPASSKIAYVGAADGNGQQQGGLYRTTDGGVSWEKIARKGPEHFGAYLHPKKRGWIYMTLCEGAPGAGLWLSKDNGASWTAIEGLPFSNVQRVAFDPQNDNTIYVTTFGGSVWRGPASE